MPPKPEAPPIGYTIMSDGSVLMGDNTDPRTCPMDPFTLMLAQHMHGFVRQRMEQRRAEAGEESMEEEQLSDSSEEEQQGEDKAAGSKDLDKKETMDTTEEKETQKTADKKKEQKKNKNKKKAAKGRYHKRWRPLLHALGDFDFGC